MAYMRSLQRKCQSCNQLLATVGLFNWQNEPVAELCDRCAPKRLNDLNDAEIRQLRARDA